MLTLTGAGDALVDAARVLSTDVLGLSGSDPENLSQEVKPRSTAKTRTLEDLGIDSLALSGYGSVTQQFELRQDSFGVPVSSMDLHLEGSHTAFPEASGGPARRTRERRPGRLRGAGRGGDVRPRRARPEQQAPLGQRHPAHPQRRGARRLGLHTAVHPAPPRSTSTPRASTVTVTHGTGQARRLPALPADLRGHPPGRAAQHRGRQASAAINAAALIAELQRAGRALLDIQLMEPDAFLADDRSGLIVGALAADSEALDAPLKLSSTRLLDREDGDRRAHLAGPLRSARVHRPQRPAGADARQLGAGQQGRPGELARKVVDCRGQRRLGATSTATSSSPTRRTRPSSPPAGRSRRTRR